ncbi:ZIP family metal transporter [Candidatus Woesearchaeota archaeon]|nr:ZIP family metal transporter [Candidatus Woesearchaeota archaeon]
METTEKQNKLKLWVSALLPVFLLIILLFVFLKFGPLGVFKSSVPPIEVAFIQRVAFSPEHITLEVFNDGPEPVTIAQVMVNGAYWKFDMEQSKTLNPLEKGKIDIFYPWLDGDFEKITLISRNGVTFEKEIEVATLTPTFNFFYFKTFVLLGIYVGVIPVLLGLLWFPFLKMLRGRWYMFLLSLTIGLLVFLGFDALSESMGLIGSLPQAFNGIGILVIGFLLAVLTLSAVSYETQHYTKDKGEHYQALIWGYLIALGIGLHNLGEGLAIGSAYAVGEIALGSLLVIGFMVHNVTEGVAIVAPLTRAHKQIGNFLLHLVMMGLLAGIPTILGALVGGFSYSAVLGVFFLAIGAGAIFDVAFDIINQMAKGNWLSIFTVTNVLGFLTGLLIMYATGFLVLG